MTQEITQEDRLGTHRGWKIYFDPPPIPARNCDWHAVHPDYEASWQGEETGWVENIPQAFAATRTELIEEIDQLQDEWDEVVGQFEVGV